MKDAGAIGRACALPRRARGAEEPKTGLETSSQAPSQPVSLIPSFTRACPSLTIPGRGSVYSAGFGAIGLGPQHLESSFVQRVETLEGEGITRIRAGWGWSAAVRDDGVDSAIFTWGLNSSDGRLGVGSVPSRTLPTPATPARPQPQLASDKRSLKGIRESSSIEIPMHIHLPTQIVLPLPALGLLGVEGRGTTSALEWDVGEVECGQDELWVSLIAESAELPDGIVVQRDY